MKYITLRIPVIDTGDTPEQKRRKMLEEIDELNNEFGAKVDMRAAMEEFFDVAQVMIGYVLAQENEMSIDAAVSWTNLQIQMANARHIQKMDIRAVERKWKVV